MCQTCNDAWDAFGAAFDAWEKSLPFDSEIHDMDYLRRLDEYWVSQGESRVFASCNRCELSDEPIYGPTHGTHLCEICPNRTDPFPIQSQQATEG